MTSLSDIRKELKKEIEAAELFGKVLFNVWINEETISQPMSEDSWAVCMKEAKDCDMFISLYHGHAGYQKIEGDIGI